MWKSKVNRKLVVIWEFILHFSIESNCILDVIYNQPKTPKFQLGQACDYFINDVFTKMMFHINDGSFMQAAAKIKQLNEQRERINSQILSRVQELFWKGQSKCLEYQLIKDLKSHENQTDALLQLDLFNDSSLQDTSSNGNSETHNTCTGCCKTKANNYHPAFEPRNDSMQAAGVHLQEMDIKLTNLDTELDLMKLRLNQLGSTEIVESQIEILSREQQQISLRLNFVEESMANVQSPHEIFFIDELEASITENLGTLREQLILIQGQMETKMSKADFEAALKVTENRLAAIESQLASSQQHIQPLPPTQNANLDTYMFCLEFAKRVKTKRLDEYFNSDTNMIYFIFKACVDNDFL